MSFWHEDKPILGTPEEAFTKAFGGNIADNTKALAVINAITHTQDQGQDIIKITWEITGGDYKGRQVFQKLKVFNADDHIRHKAKSMLKLLFVMFGVKPLTDGPPTSQDLAQLQGKHAGIKIQEWFINKDNGQLATGNYVSEVHPLAGFTPEIGRAKNPPPSPVSNQKRIEVEFSSELNDDIPF